MRVGVLTGGGDAPGLNAAIRAIARRCFEHGHEVVGIKNGWAGLLGEGDVESLSLLSVSGILHLGGTVLGTSRTNPLKAQDGMAQILANLQRYDIGALAAIGGDDTLRVANALCELGVQVVGVPKTVDNDLAETDYCIGFNSAVSIVTDALDKLHTTASAHHRVLVVEVMGRDTGWVAVVGGLAGGADMILVPEVPVHIDRLCRHLQERRRAGKDFSIIVLAEGVDVPEAVQRGTITETDAFGHVRLERRGVGETISRLIEQRTGFETRTTVLGHLQRGGAPTVYDRVMATRLGVAAADLIHQGASRVMVAVKGDQVVPVPLARAVGSTRGVDLELYRLAEIFF